MGAKFSCVLFRGSEKTLTTLASIAADIAGEFENVFTATMTAGSDLRDSEPIWCVDLKWNARGVSRATSPMIQLLRAFGESPQMLALSDTCREDPRSRLAIEASQLAGSSLYLSYSDTLCSSYYILFDQGVIRRLSGYGMGGGEGFVQLLAAGVQARDIPLEQIRYEQPAIHGLKEFTNFRYGPRRNE